jgi:hypothetical protein
MEQQTYTLETLPSEEDWPMCPDCGSPIEITSDRHPWQDGFVMTVADQCIVCLFGRLAESGKAPVSKTEVVLMRDAEVQILHLP